MALYTLESPHSIPRLTHALVTVNTSYLIALSDVNNAEHAIANTFHAAGRASNVDFMLNALVRQEFVKWIRASLLLEAILEAVRRDATLEPRYRRATGIARRPLNKQAIKNKHELIYKDHVRQRDEFILLSAMPKQIWDEVRRLEMATQITYLEDSASLDWQEVEGLMRLTGLAVTDAIIGQFAAYTQSGGIVTNDIDFAALADIFDVYMPRVRAQQCTAYDPARD